MNVKIKYEPRKRNYRLPVLFHMFFFILVAFLEVGLSWKEEMIIGYYSQMGYLALMLLIYWSLIVKRKERKKGSFEQILQKWIGRNS